MIELSKTKNLTSLSTWYVSWMLSYVRLKFPTLTSCCDLDLDPIAYSFKMDTSRGLNFHPEKFEQNWLARTWRDWHHVNFMYKFHDFNEWILKFEIAYSLDRNGLCRHANAQSRAMYSFWDFWEQKYWTVWRNDIFW